MNASTGRYAVCKVSALRCRWNRNKTPFIRQTDCLKTSISLLRSHRTTCKFGEPALFVANSDVRYITGTSALSIRFEAVGRTFKKKKKSSLLPRFLKKGGGFDKHQFNSEIEMNVSVNPLQLRCIPAVCQAGACVCASGGCLRGQEGGRKPSSVPVYHQAPPEGSGLRCSLSETLDCLASPPPPVPVVTWERPRGAFRSGTEFQKPPEV